MAEGVDDGIGFGITIDADLSAFNAKIENLPNEVRRVGGEPTVKINVDDSQVIDVAKKIADLKPTIKPIIDTSNIQAKGGGAYDIEGDYDLKPQVRPKAPQTVYKPADAAADVTGAANDAIQTTATAAKQAGGILDTLKTKLTALRSQGGRGSGIGQLGQLVNGGGALIGVTLIGRALEQATAKMADLSAAFRKGQTDASGLAVGIGESLPIFGSFVTAGQNIREAIYGEKAALDEVNKSIEVGNKLIEDRQAAYETTRNATQNLNDRTEDIQGRIAVLNAPNEIERHKVEIDVGYKTDSRSLQEQTTRDIEARKKELVQTEDDITKSYADKNLDAPKEPIDPEDESAVAAEKKRQQLVQEKSQKIQGAQIKAKDDVAQIQAAAAADQKALDQWHTAAVAKATGIGEELKKLNAEIAEKLATTDTEKVEDYKNKMVAAGHSTADAATLAAKFGDELKADHLAAFNGSLQELSDKLQTVGDNAKETAINEMALQLSRSGVSAAEAATKLDEYRKKYDQVQESLKRAAFGDAIKGLQEQTAKFGATPIERANKLADFDHATDKQRQEYIRLTVEVEHEEKLQQVADMIKNLKEQAAAIPNLNFGNPTDADEVLAKLKASKEYSNATPEQQQQLIKLTVQVDGEQKAEQLYGKLKDIDQAYQDIGKSEIEKQIAEMERLAKASGDTADKTEAINKARKELEASKVGDFVRDTNEQTKEIGESEPDKAVDRLKSQGVTDPKLLGDAWTSAAKKAGAELKEAVESPLDKLAKQVRELDQLRNAGAIDDKTYRQAKVKDQGEAASSLQGKSIEETFKDNLNLQLLPMFGDKGQDKKEKATIDNTKAVVDLSKAQIAAKASFDQFLTNGIAATYSP